MVSIKKIFTSLLCSLFTLFLSNTSVMMAGELYDEKVIFVTVGISDLCSTNIQCEQKSDDTYVCQSVGDVFSHTTQSIHGVPTSSLASVLVSSALRGVFDPIVNLCNRRVIYTGPDTYVYPFVRIIKIQV